MLEAAIRQKMHELVGRSDRLIPVGGSLRDNHHLGLCRGWLTEALNVIELAVPIENNAYRRQAKAITEQQSSVVGQVASLSAILGALAEDLNNGLIADFGNRIRAETFDDFLDHADIYREEGQHQPAGVLAGVVFEDAIRRICRDMGITEKGKELEQLINALSARTAITGQQAKQARVAAHVRTKATHAQWDEYDLDGVGETITITRTFLRDHLGG